MRVFLIQDVKNLGRKGQIKEVNDGYARNFLFAQKLAVVPTDVQTKKIIEEKSIHKKVVSQARATLEEKVEMLNNKTFVFNSKADKNGHLYGSIGPKDLAGKTGVDEKMFHEHFKEIGKYSLTLSFDSDLLAKVNIVIEKEK